MNDFGLWISKEIEHRGWSRSEVARRGGISPSTIDKVINEFAKPGPKLCLALARAFSLPDEDVFRLAGLLKPTTHSRINARRIVHQESAADRLLELWRGLSAEDQGRMLDLLERLQVVAPRIIGEVPEEESHA